MSSVFIEQLRPSQDYINEDVSRLHRILKDIDPTLELRWIPPEMRTEQKDHEYPYVIMVFPYVGEPYIYRHLKEKDLNANLLADIMCDKKNTENLTDILEAQDIANNLLLAKRWEEEQEKAKDEMMFWIRQPKHRVQLGKGVYRDV